MPGGAWHGSPTKTALVYGGTACANRHAISPTVAEAWAGCKYRWILGNDQEFWACCKAGVRWPGCHRKPAVFGLYSVNNEGLDAERGTVGRRAAEVVCRPRSGVMLLVAKGFLEPISGGGDGCGCLTSAQARQKGPGKRGADNPDMNVGAKTAQGMLVTAL